MSFVRNSTIPRDDDTKTGTSTATWQSIASVDSTLLTSVDDNHEKNTFLNPAEPSNHLSATAWAQERTSQHEDFRREALGEDQYKGGCCSRWTLCWIKALHVIDGSFGLAGIVYGSLLCTQFEDPALAAALFCLILGSIHLSTSMLGLMSFGSRRCTRCGLVVSGFVAPYIAFVYVTIFIALLADSSGLFSYLEDHQGVMYLGENVVRNWERLMPLLYVLLALFSVAEVLRFVTLRKLRERLLLSDASDRYNTADFSTGNNDLSEALLGNDNGSVQASEVGATSVDSASKWWEN
eukprot:CAMPEP_0171406304 /NCGR_PEP_ID=MMETSP0880-20121228/17523_1 /TAXON_ID=67004 /ORGANISM="Thalassiosira weissflogii, Strain CCMP1336" /LENGTH=293 /DNA_ID=CAMNT_0011921977 /DNA_START=37 /DNA_END=918 /DNA_ORIENTATION=+